MEDEQKFRTLPEDHPAVIAFNAYKAGEHYAEQIKWVGWAFDREGDLVEPGHIEAALWQAFVHGYDAVAPKHSLPIDRNFETIAIIAHEVNRAWCEFMGDTSQVPWDEAPDWQRKSAISGAIFHAKNPSAGDDASHNNWMEEKLADGWVYGPVKDPEAKTHPCIMPFEQLPAQQQFKDRLFRTVVRTALDMYGGHGGFAIENLNALAEFMVNEMGYEPPVEEVSIVASVMGKMLELKLTVEALRHELISRFSQKVQAPGDPVTPESRELELAEEEGE